jgi:protein TilB
VETARELAKLRQKDEPTAKKIVPPNDAMPDRDGRVMQRNEGKWNWKYIDCVASLAIDVEISKFMDTSLIDVEVKATYIRIVIKNKLLQLMLPDRVLEGDEHVLCERSRLRYMTRVFDF